MSDRDKVIEMVNSNDIERIRLLYTDNASIPRGRIHKAEDIESLMENGTNITSGMQSFNALDHLTSDGTFGPVGEVRMVPDPETFRILPYAEDTALMLCDLHEPAGGPWEADPRVQLQRFLDDIAEDGYTPNAAFENEFYLTRETEEGTVPFDQTYCFAPAGMHTAEPIINDMMDALEAQQMGISAYYPEYGPGQQELVIDHAKGARPADNQILYRETIKAVAYDNEVGATLAPKPFPELPGNGCHMHLSLWQDGENALADPDGEPPFYLGDRGRHFIGGVMEHLPALVALTAPTVDSYSRLQPGMWASAYTIWGFDNREAAVRVPSTDKTTGSDATRIELKSSDNTSNPYLALLGLLAAGMDGIDRELDPGEPTNTDPGALSDAERADRGIEPLPDNLGEAVSELESDDVLRDAMGDLLHDSYVEVKRSEWEESKNDGGGWDGDYLNHAHGL